MFNVTSRTVTTKVIDLSLDEELASHLAQIIGDYHNNLTRRSQLPSKVIYELETLANSLKGHL
jgi:hypothetical protein